MEPKLILVVEDNADEATIYTTLLRYHGYEVVTATDYGTALDVARTRRPSLAILDVNLGDGNRDGCDLAAALRADASTAHIPVIAHTAFGDVYRRRLADTGCDSILHKPTNPAHLLGSIRDLIGPGLQQVE
jgi:CheY-like chemotaxis protein